MSQEDDLRGLAKVMDFMRALSVLFVVVNIYWFCYPAIREWNVSIGVVDRILLNFQRTTGLFGSILWTKLFSVTFLALSCLGTKGVKEEKIKWAHIWTALSAGVVLFFFNWWLLSLSVPLMARTAFYILTIAVGYLCLLAAGVWIDLGKRTFVLVEYGIESTDDETLRRINRGHTFAVSAEAVRKTAERGILVGGHIILGLPGEEREMLIRQAGVLSQLPLTTLKLHQLQLIKGTRMASEYVKEPEAFHLYTADEYVDLVIDYIEHLRPDIVLERFVSQSPKELLIAPDWGLKNYEFTDKVKKRMREKDAWQGKYYKY